MCGIAGLYNYKKNKDMAQCRDIAYMMEQAIAHRGPDASKIWQDHDIPLALAHRRLAVIDLSPDGEQPMASPSRRYMISYNGEIYNYRELRIELEALGHEFKTQSDTEVMLGVFEEWGVVDGIKKCDGMFAVSLFDRKEKQLYLLRDRFGKKPLYVGWSGDDLIFGSELKSFHAHPEFEGAINRDVVALYMRYGYVCAPYCIYKQVWQLLPGSYISFDLQALQKHDLSKDMQYYWDLSEVVTEGKEDISRQSEHDLVNEFELLLEDCVQQRMISDVPFGAFLSGGIDSSTIVSLMQKNSQAAVKTFSIGFQEAGYNEAEHAKKIAAYLGTDHTEFYVSAQDALDIIPALPDIYDEPFSDPSQIPTALISKLARDHVTVVLTGDGGDEILGGYQRHTHVTAAWDKVKSLPQGLRQMISDAVQKLPVREAYKRIAQLMALQNEYEIYHALISHGGSAHEIVEGAVVPFIPLDRVKPEELNFAEIMIYSDMLQYRSDDLMVKTDRASMAVALEARAPLMDHKLAEYCWWLPHNMKIRGMEGKWILRQVLKRYIPQNLYDRPKMGFSVPIHGWLQGPLREWAGDLLSPDTINRQGILNNDDVQAIWQSCQIGKLSKENAEYLWSILMFQAWLMRWS